MIKIVCVGKIKEQFLVDGIKEYQKRMESWKGVEIIEVKECNNASTTKTKELEGELILDKISKEDYVITLEIEGKMIDSIELSKI